MNIKQGHKYLFQGVEVIALSSGSQVIRVAELDHSQPYPLGPAKLASAHYLEPLPMAYFHGEVPA